jgi:exopolysaccharide/PEP-CTERM locus tyrosine autokinase
MNMLDIGMPQLQGEKRGMEPADILRILWGRKWLILIPLMVAIMFGGVLCRILPKLYTSTSIIYFKRPEYAVENPSRDWAVSYQVMFKDRAQMLITDVTQQSKLEEVFEKQGLIDKSRPQSFMGRIRNFLFGIDPGKDPSVTEQFEDARDSLDIQPREDRPAILIKYTTTDAVTARNVCDEIGKLLEQAEQVSGERLKTQKETYNARCDAAKKALDDTQAKIRVLLTDAMNKRTDPQQLPTMYQKYETLGHDIQDLSQKINEDSFALQMQRIMLPTIERIKETPLVEIPAPGKEQQPEEQLWDKVIKDYEDYIKKNPDDPKSRKMGEALPALREKAREQNAKIDKLPIELPRLLAEQERINKHVDDNSKLGREKAAKIEEISKTLIDEDKKRAANDSSAKSMEEIDTLRKQKGTLEDESKALMAEIAKDQRTLRGMLSDIKEYKALAQLTGYKVPEPDKTKTPEGGGTPENPEEQNAALNALLKDYFPNGVPQNINPDWLDVVRKIVSLDAAIKRNIDNLDLLKKQQTEQNDKINEAIKTQGKLDELRAKEKNDETAYGKAQALLEAAIAIENLWNRSHESGENADVRRYPAELPLVNSSPKFGIIMLLAIVGGMVIGGALTLLAEMTDHTIKRPTDLRRFLDRPVLASIPALDIGRFHTPENLFFRTKRAVEADLESGILFDKNYVKDIRFRSIATEQIRKLRLSMQTPDGERIRTILVTSALAGEGKSTVAANLAVAISQMIGEYVLLIDADLRRPDLHNFFGMPPKPGLSEYLEHDIDLKQLLVKTEFEKLTLLQAGKVPANSTELLSSDRMHHLVREVKSRYPDRYIILDSPPVLSTSEPNVLANQVDGVILVVRAGMTPRELVEDVLGSISPDKVMGVVMNDVRTEAGKYYSPSYV